MKRNRKQISDLINSICSLKNRNECFKNEFIELVGEDGFGQLQGVYNKAIDVLSQQKKALPIGYRYTGEFYVRKPYMTPIRYDKISGSAFMREDLISWRIEAEHQYNNTYFRTIYRDGSGEEGRQIKREEATPFYGTED